jgi:hypothetical protein
MRSAIRSHRCRVAITILYILLATVIAGMAGQVGEAGRASSGEADELILQQAEVPVSGYWASGSPTGIVRSDGVYAVAETYTHSDPYKSYGNAELHRYVDIKIEVYENETDARKQYELVDRLFGTPVSFEGREYLKVDIERGVGIAYYVCHGDMCIGFVTNDSEAVLQQFVRAFWAKFARLRAAELADS